MKPLWSTMIGVLMIVGVAGCTSVSYDPVAVKINQDSCYECNMGIEHEHAASQVILEDGKPRMFDDIGCLVTYLQAGSEQPKAIYVHDQLSGKWIDFQTASFVQAKEIPSPMNYGVAAFQEQSAAEQFHLEKGGTLYKSTELLQIDMKKWKEEQHGTLAPSHAGAGHSGK